jgi:hypothetical protein
MCRLPAVDTASGDAPAAAAGRGCFSRHLRLLVLVVAPAGCMPPGVWHQKPHVRGWLPGPQDLQGYDAHPSSRSSDNSSSCRCRRCDRLLAVQHICMHMPPTCRPGVGNSSGCSGCNTWQLKHLERVEGLRLCWLHTNSGRRGCYWRLASTPCQGHRADISKRNCWV